MHGERVAGQEDYTGVLLEHCGDCTVAGEQSSTEKAEHIIQVHSFMTLALTQGSFVGT